MPIGYPQPNRGVIPSSLRESMNLKLLPKIKFERAVNEGAKKAAGGNPPAAVVSRLRTLYAFIPALTAAAVIGSERTRAPQALKMALPTAGATTVTAGSPTPVA
jgi:hypothetical protein